MDSKKSGTLANLDDLHDFLADCAVEILMRLHRLLIILFEPFLKLVVVNDSLSGSLTQVKTFFKEICVQFCK